MWTLQQWLLLIHLAMQNRHVFLRLTKTLHILPCCILRCCNLSQLVNKTTSDVSPDGFIRDQRKSNDEAVRRNVRRGSPIVTNSILLENAVTWVCTHTQKKNTCISCVFACDRNMNVDYMNHVISVPNPKGGGQRKKSVWVGFWEDWLPQSHVFNSNFDNQSTCQWGHYSLIVIDHNIQPYCFFFFYRRGDTKRSEHAQHDTLIIKRVSFSDFTEFLPLLLIFPSSSQATLSFPLGLLKNLNSIYKLTM